MLKNKIVVRKIRNIVILLMAIIIMFGAYKNIDKSKAEEVIEISAIAIDNYGCLENEEFILEAKEISDGLYEIEIPENINSKMVNNVVNVKLLSGELELKDENTTDESEIIEIIDNKIKLTKEQIDNKQINFETVYDMAILSIDEQGLVTKEILNEKSEEEIKNNIEELGEELLYNKILRYEDKETGGLVEVKGYVHENENIQIEKVEQEKLQEVFGEKQIDLAYNIKVIAEVETEIPTDEANPNAETEKVIENIEVDPLEYGDSLEVYINNSKISNELELYHIKDDNTYDRVAVKENTGESITFDAYFSTVYAICAKEDEISVITPPSFPNIEVGASTTSTYTDIYAPSSGSWKYSNSAYSHYLGVSIPATINGSAVHYWAWSANTTTPSVWTSIDELEDNIDYKFIYFKDDLSSGYLHSKTANGNMYYSGPYNLTKGTENNYVRSNVTIENDTNGWNPDVSIIVYDKNSSLANSTVRAEWGLTPSPGTDNSTLINVTSTNSKTHTYLMPKPTEGGHYYLQYKYWGQTENMGAATIEYTRGWYTQHFDYNAPTITFSKDSNTSWAKTHSVDVTISDDFSGFDEGATIQYGWSTSNTTPPSPSSLISAGTYTKGSRNFTFTANGSGLSGKYYLWVVQSGLKDVAGNAYTGNKVSTGQFWFDNEEPKISFEPNENHEWKKEHTVEIIFSDDLSGLYKANHIVYDWGKHPNALSNLVDPNNINKNDEKKWSITYNTDEQLTGEYRLYVNALFFEDIAGNTNNMLFRNHRYVLL